MNRLSLVRNVSKNLVQRMGGSSRMTGRPKCMANRSVRGDFIAAEGDW